MTLVLEGTVAGAALLVDAQDRHLRRRGLSGPTPRPAVTVRLILTPAGGGVGSGDGLQMVTTTTRAGLVVGHGHVRSGDNHRTTTRLQPGAYRLRIEARGYEPVTVDDVVIPAADEPATRVAADLDPAADYPFPDEVALPPAGAPRPPRPAGATLLRGTAVEIPPVEPGAPQPPPQPLRGVRVFAPGAPASVSGRTGGWVLAFRPGTPAGPVDVTLSASGKTPQTVTADLVPGYRQTLDVVEMTDA